MAVLNLSLATLEDVYPTRPPSVWLLRTRYCGRGVWERGECLERPTWGELGLDELYRPRKMRRAKHGPRKPRVPSTRRTPCRGTRP